MPGLLDIAPVAETVVVRDRKVEVCGVSAKGIAYLLGKFPELRMLMAGREVAPDQLMQMGGDAVAAIIAAGCGYPGSEEAEAVASSLTIEEQADLLSVILKRTMPNGLGPFVDKLTGLVSLVGSAPSVAAPVTKSRKASMN